MRFLNILVLLSLSINVYAQEAEPKPAEPEKEPITKIQFTQQQQALFNKVDKDFDGRITMNESQAKYRDDQKEKIKDVFKTRDLDSSGYLTFDEILSWHEGYTEGKLKKQDRKKEKFLRTYDKDGNGTISSYEIDAYFEDEKQKYIDSTVEKAQNDFDNKDLDKSGTVSIEEYTKNKESYIITAGRPAREDMVFLKRDGNGDYIITRTENEAFIPKIFEKLDVNGDDELSNNEQKHRAFRITQSMGAQAGYYFKKEK